MFWEVLMVEQIFKPYSYWELFYSLSVCTEVTVITQRANYCQHILDIAWVKLREQVTLTSVQGSKSSEPESAFNFCLYSY